MEELLYQKLGEVQQAGNKSEIAFIKDSFELPKLREIKSADTNALLGLILQQASVLAGIKDGIQEIVKNDLKDLIYSRFGGLSLEEIAYAFKLERQLVYSTKSDHFQFFSTEYVAEILSKYVEWKAQKRRSHNVNPKTDKKEIKLTDEDKVLLFFTGIIGDFNHFKNNNELDFGAIRHYLPLFNLGLLPKHDDDFKEQIKIRVLDSLKKDLTKENDRKERSFLKQIIESQMTDEVKFKTKAKQIIIMDFFNKIIEKNSDISDILREKTNGLTHSEIIKKIKY